MRDKIKSALKNKYANLGFSDKVLDKVATYLEASTTKEEDIDNAVNGVEPLLQSFQSDFDALRTAKSGLEKELSSLKKPDTKKVEAGAEAKTETETNTDTPAWAKALIESQKALNEKIAALEGEKVTNTRKQQLDAIIGKLPEQTRKAYSHIKFNDMTDDDFAQLKTEVESEVGDFLKDEKIKGIQFGQPVSKGFDSSNGGNQIKEATKEEAEKVTAQMKF